jgi:hypothetical protein
MLAAGVTLSNFFYDQHGALLASNQVRESSCEG